MRFTGKTALVTGGSRGIGRAIVQRLARDGATVVFTFKENRAAADDLVSQVAGTVAVRADQEELTSITAMFQPVRDGLDILVNNAAINPRTPIANITEEEFDRVMTINAKFPVLAMREAAAVLRDNGRIINISTLNTVLPAPGHALYCASKAGLRRVPGLSDVSGKPLT
jgi:3-oxoacyl-[acyl-carrier protein] reductase